MPALISGRAFLREENKLFIKGGVSEVHIFLVKLLLDQLDSLAKPLEMNDFPLSKESDDIAHIWVVR